MDIDEIDTKLLTLLQKDSRTSLTTLAKAVKLSIDSTHKRMKKLQASGVIANYGIFIDPKALGYELVASVHIKVSNVSDEDMQKFLAYLCTHPQAIEVITTLGEYDITCVLIAKSTAELETVSRQIRHQFKHLIADWKSVINLKVYKFEEYTFS